MFESIQQDGVRVVCATGRLIVGAGADHVTWPVPAAAGELTDVVVNLRRVTALDAAGLGALLRLREAVAGRGARLTLAAAPPRVRRVLHLAGLEAIFAIAPGPDAAPAAPWRAAVDGGLCQCA